MGRDRDRAASIPGRHENRSDRRPGVPILTDRGFVSADHRWSMSDSCYDSETSLFPTGKPMRMPTGQMPDPQDIHEDVDPMLRSTPRVTDHTGATGATLPATQSAGGAQQGISDGMPTHRGHCCPLGDPADARSHVDG